MQVKLLVNIDSYACPLIAYGVAALACTSCSVKLTSNRAPLVCYFIAVGVALASASKCSLTVYKVAAIYTAVKLVLLRLVNVCASCT